MLGGVADHELEPVDGHQPRERRPVERVEEDEAARPDHARCLRQHARGFLHVLQHVEQQDSVVRRVVRVHVRRVPDAERSVGAFGEALAGDVERTAGEVDALDAVPSVREGDRDEASPAGHVQHARALCQPVTVEHFADVGDLEVPLGAEQGDGVAVVLEPPVTEVFVERVVDGRHGGWAASRRDGRLAAFPEQVARHSKSRAEGDRANEGAGRHALVLGDPVPDVWERGRGHVAPVAEDGVAVADAVLLQPQRIGRAFDHARAAGVDGEEVHVVHAEPILTEEGFHRSGHVVADVGRDASAQRHSKRDTRRTPRHLVERVGEDRLEVI